MNTLCGIEISDEHAERIKNTCNRIIEGIEQRRQKEKKERFIIEFRSMQRTNPHNTFTGTPLQYLEKYPDIK